jgi:hypothetical protein
MFGSIGLPEAILVVSFASVALLASMFWIWMLIDAATKETDPHDRLLWVVIIIFTHIVGAAIYFVLRRTPRMRTAA